MHLSQCTCDPLRYVLRRLLAAAFIAFFLATPASAQIDSDSVYDWLEEAHDTLDGLIKDVTDGQYELPYELLPREEFLELLSSHQATFFDIDQHKIAVMDDVLRAAEIYINKNPELQPYADWVHQHLDYTQVAREAEVLFPQSQPKPPPGPSTAPQQPEPPQSRSRIDHASSTTTWKKKLEGRSTPPNAQSLLPRLKGIFKKQGLPEELVWMAEVESTFNPAAKSPAGAVGLFQLMPKTAEHLGLSTKPVDERADPIKNATAAASYLSYLHGRFNDWPLAIAAYNGGEGRIGKLIDRHATRDFAKLAPHLPTETRMYVPKVLATIELREGKAFL